MKTPNSLEQTNKHLLCDGSCEIHIGSVRKVNVSAFGFDWGSFYYCEAAINEDINRGLRVKTID